VTCVSNTRTIDIKALNGFLKSKGMQISDGYGPLKGQTFRIAHLGEIQMRDVNEVLERIDDFVMREDGRGSAA
jgi:aspartate aminotransferase-like enzyme